MICDDATMTTKYTLFLDDMWIMYVQHHRKAVHRRNDIGMMDDVWVNDHSR